MSWIECCSCTWKWLLKWLFNCLSFVTFQYVPDVKIRNDESIKEKRCKVRCSFFFTIYMLVFTFFLGIIINLFPTVLLIMDWSLCPINYYNICYILEFHSVNGSSKVPTIVLRSEDDDGKMLQFHLIFNL